MSEIDLEKLCIAFGWAYGTELERTSFGREPDDGLTPETLWAQSDEEGREFARRVMRETLAASGLLTEITRLRTQQKQLIAALHKIAVGGANEIEIARAAVAAVEEKP